MDETDRFLHKLLDVISVMFVVAEQVIIGATFIAIAVWCWYAWPPLGIVVIGLIVMKIIKFFMYVRSPRDAHDESQST